MGTLSDRSGSSGMRNEPQGIGADITRTRPSLEATYRLIELTGGMARPESLISVASNLVANPSAHADPSSAQPAFRMAVWWLYAFFQAPGRRGGGVKALLRLSYWVGRFAPV